MLFNTRIWFPFAILDVRKYAYFLYKCLDPQRTL